MAQAPATTSLEVGFKPKQNIPEHLKDVEWAQRNVDWCISMAPIYWKNYDNNLYDLYNGVRKEDDYKHITETYGVEFPAGKIKHVPLVRPLLNVLEGEYEQRPLNFQVRSEDNDSINTKLETMRNNLLDQIVEVIRSGGNVDVKMDELEKYYKEDFQTSSEIAAHHALKYYINKHHLERNFKDNFVDKIITGKELYRVQVNRIGEDPVYTDIRSGQLYWANNNEKWIKNTDWAVYPVRMSPTEILDSYGERMNPEDRAKVEDWIDQYYRDSYKLNSYQEADRIMEDTEDWSSYYAALNGMITVYHVEWKSIRKVKYIENPNPYVEDAPFVKYIPEDKLNNPVGSRKKNLQERYVQDLWQGMRIGDNIYVDLGRVKYARRDFSKPSKVYLTFNGPTYSGKIKPYSLVHETKDLQNLYDILHYHKENLIAISGVKGMVMDSSQVPDFGVGDFEDNIKMWMYYKKLGTAWINRSQEGADLSFNQFSTYDDSLGPGLEAVLSMIQHLEDLAGRIIGVNRQRMGAISQREGKGTTEHALVQSALSTEPIFAEHGEFIRQAMEDILDACKVAWKNGYTSSYISDQYLQQIFTFDPETSNSDFGVYVTNLETDKRSIDELKAFSYQLVQQGMMEFDDIMPLFRKSNLKDIEKTVSVGIARKKKEMAEKEQQMAAVQQQLEQAKTQGEIAKLQAEVQKLYAESEQLILDGQNDQTKISNEAETDRQKIALEGKRVALEQAELGLAASDKQNDVQKSKEVSND